jgi:hypothetical protein
MHTVSKGDDTRNAPAKGSQHAALHARARRIVARMRKARAARPAEFENVGHPGPRSKWEDTPAGAALLREARRVRGLLIAARVQSARSGTSPSPVRPGTSSTPSRRSASSAGGGDPRPDDPGGGDQPLDPDQLVAVFRRDFDAVEVAMDCSYPADHLVRHLPHPISHRVICWLCHTPASALVVNGGRL